MGRFELFVRDRLAHLMPRTFVDELFLESNVLARQSMSRLVNGRKFRGKSEIKVNIGCGEQPVEGWVNLDTLKRPGVTYWDCRRRLPLDGGSVAMVFAEHFFEHLDYPDYTEKFLRESRRCLKPGGVVRLVVPDAGRYLKEYGRPWDEMVRMRPLAPEQGKYRDLCLNQTYDTQMQFLNAIFRQSGEHKYAYDSETLCSLLRNAGFADVTERSFGQSAIPELGRLDTPQRRFESLYVEAARA